MIRPVFEFFLGVIVVDIFVVVDCCHVTIVIVYCGCQKKKNHVVSQSMIDISTGATKQKEGKRKSYESM